MPFFMHFMKMFVNCYVCSAMMYQIKQIKICQLLICVCSAISYRKGVSLCWSDPGEIRNQLKYEMNSCFVDVMLVHQTMCTIYEARKPCHSTYMLCFNVTRINIQRRKKSQKKHLLTWARIINERTERKVIDSCAVPIAQSDRFEF